MSSEFKVKRSDLIPSRVNLNSIKFLTALNLWGIQDEIVASELRTTKDIYFRAFIEKNQSPKSGIFAVQHCALYVGYVEVSDADALRSVVSQDAVFLRPPYDVTLAAGVLLEKAAVSVEPSPLPVGSEPTLIDA